MKFDKVAILGVGLMGASFALAMRKKDLCGTITGSGRTEEHLARAQERHIIDLYTLDHAEACEDADLVVLATPVGRFKDLLAAVKGSLKQGALVTDLGSVKGNLVYELEALVPAGVSYVGSHPIAGNDKSGIDAATPSLFEHALCIVTPTDRTWDEDLKTMEELWTSLGARVKRMPPDEHDLIFSAVSHLPHMAAFALVNTVAGIDPSFILFAGQGFRDTTRVAMSSSEMWTDICRYNRDHVRGHVDALMGRLQTVRDLLDRGDYAALEQFFKEARELRRSIG